MSNFMIRCVGVVALVIVMASLAHGNAPSGRYTVTGGTVYDTKTKLTWQQAASPSKSCWECAKNSCASLSGGWHLPTMKELQTIVDYSRSNPAVDPTAFPSTPGDRFWSSTPAAEYASTAWPKAWTVDFYSGGTQSFEVAIEVGYEFYARCVR